MPSRPNALISFWFKYDFIQKYTKHPKFDQPRLELMTKFALCKESTAYHVDFRLANCAINFCFNLFRNRYRDFCEDLFCAIVFSSYLICKLCSIVKKDILK